ncbi:MAG: MMPL family transporter [Microthrixaceae bacterium]
MTDLLHKVGRFASRRRLFVLVAWILVIVSLVGANKGLGSSAVDNFEVPGVESQQARDLLSQRFPQKAGATAMVVFHVPNGGISEQKYGAGIAATIDEIRALDHVTSVVDPLATPVTQSQDGTTAVAAVQFDQSTAELGHPALGSLTATAGPARAVGVQTEFGGELPTVLKEQSTGPAEAIGVIAALVILLISFRSIIDMALPLLTAAAGLITVISAIGLLAGVIEIPTVAPRLGMMIGLGVGIDYALFVLSRHRDQVIDGMPIEESIAHTNATAGNAVVIAGMTVVIAILGLKFAGIPFVAALGYSASIVVAIAVAVAVTLLPAMLSFVGPRILPRHLRQGESNRVTRMDSNGERAAGAEGASTTDRPPSGWVRWAHWVAHHPWRSSIAATAVLLIAAIPLGGMHLGQADAGSQPSDTTQRKAYDLLDASFGPGFNGPLLIVADLGSGGDPVALERIVDSVRADPGVKAVGPPQINDANDTALITAIPKTTPQDQATADLVHRLRADTLPSAVRGGNTEVYVGGPTAGFVDQSDKIAARLPWFIAGVVGLSFLLLMIVFRSLLVPLKAAILNLLSIAAAYGVVVAVFQWGWGRSLIGLEESVPIASFVPMMMFAILFGLSMDYEVFILSRIREEHLAGRSNIDSVVAGLGATAKVITAAALIMVSVFLGFVGSPDPVVKMMGVGLATAVTLDATIVRMVLLPATMALVGEPNWWLPKWLDRVLPHMDVEGGVDSGPSSLEAPSLEA